MKRKKKNLVCRIKDFVFEKQNTKERKFIKILGIKIKEKKYTPQETVSRFFGIPYKRKAVIIPPKKPKTITMEQMFMTISCAEQHKQVFPQFKNINLGKDVVIIGTGPTLSLYEPIKNAVNIGLNRAYQFKKTKMDYLFMIDGTATKDFIDEIDKMQDVKKFYGLHFLNETFRPGFRLPEYHLLHKNTFRFYCSPYRNKTIRTDISTWPLYQMGSSAFPALHFALWTHPKRIFLVGCDTNSAPYWDGAERKEEYVAIQDQVNQWMVDGYIRMKEFAEICYPDVEIISINPVGLKGIFTDIYTGD